MREKQGLTLAEILVTMAVAGVLAGVLIPALSNAKPNAEMVMLKKVYYLTTRTVNELINDDEFYPEANGGENFSGFSNTASASYHGRTYGEDGENGPAGKFCSLFAARMNLRGPANCSRAISLDAGGNFTTADGVVWSLPISNFNRGNNDSTQAIQIDVNGLDKVPNCTEQAFRAGNNQCRRGGSGPDRFTITVDRFGVINVPQNAIEQNYLTSNDTTRRYRDFRP